jgi:hypothetical protein
MNQVERCPWCGSQISHAKFVEIEARIRAEEQRKSQAQEAALRARMEEDFKAKLGIETNKAVRAATLGHGKILQQKDNEHQQALLALQAEIQQKGAALEAANGPIDRILASKLSEQRAVLDADRDKQLGEKEAEHRREMAKLQDQLKELSRRLEKKTANDLGEVPEINLFEKLREDYPDDKIVRVKKGEPGADIHQTVIHRNETCGLIIIDSKNHLAWRSDFVTKLKEDQARARADHAILSTSAFPSGQKGLCILDGVIAVSPVHTTHIVQIFRRAMITLHKQGLSQRERQTKVEAIYQLITSEEYARKLMEANRLGDRILDLDAEEKKQHDKTWKSRGNLTKNLKHTLQEIEDDVYAIIGGKGTESLEEDPVTQEEGTSF